MSIWELYKSVEEFQKQHNLIGEQLEFPHMTLARVQESLEVLAASNSFNTEESKCEQGRLIGQVLYHLMRYAKHHDIQIDHALLSHLIAASDQLRAQRKNGPQAEIQDKNPSLPLGK